MVIDRDNPYARGYKRMAEVENAESERASILGITPSLVTMIFREGPDQRRYNAPVVDEVAAVFVGNDGAPPGNHDIVVYPKNQPLRNISYLNKNCDPMMYPLLFPKGLFGWDPTQLHNDGFRTASRVTVTQLQYYSYRFAVRQGFSAIHRAGKLLQQFIVDAYVKTEAARLSYIMQHQAQLRVDRYTGLMDHINSQAAAQGLDVGKIVILPSSFPGSPRNMQQQYQDSMAIVTNKGRPDLFVTYTCNPKSREITENLYNGQTAADRPDLIVRVFDLKLKEFIKDITKRDLLGRITAMTYVIEFQKRGLPHAHFLFWLHNDDKLRTPEDVDLKISAEIPDPVSQPELYEIVKSTMIHGPCGIVDGKSYDKSPCQSSGTCSKKYPKTFVHTTNISVDGYPLYRRRNDGRSVRIRDCRLDNRWVVPYSPVLSLRYGSHINVEACASIKCVKYLAKYMTKGHDCINLELTEKVYNHDEIKTFVNARYCSAPEGFWRLSEFDMHGKSHTIHRLPVHLPDQQNVYFRSGMEEEALDRAANSASQLVAWFEHNQHSTDPRQYYYCEMPLHFTFDKRASVWKPRKRGGAKMIARMYSVSPLDREKFCLRSLLLHVPGATSYEHLRTYNGVVYPLFQEACIARGLMDDDGEWDRALAEGVALLMPRQCRQLFVTILTHCQPSDPKVLWERYKESLSEDFARTLPLDVAIQTALAEINQRLSEFGMSCEDRGLPIPTLPQANSDQLNPLDDAAIATHNLSILNADQSDIVNEIWNAVDNGVGDQPNVHYLDGPAGTGKTMVYKYPHLRITF